MRNIDPASILQLFQEIGHHLLIMGLNTSHSGNISVRHGDRICIKRSGAMLGRLKEGDIITVPVDNPRHPDASIEFPVHREIYLRTPAMAVVHCHPPYAVSLSFKSDEIVPIDLEGSHHLKRVPVIAHNDHIPRKAADSLGSGAKVVLIRAHGCFASGKSLEEALHYVTALEMSAKILSLCDNLHHSSP